MQVLLSDLVDEDFRARLLEQIECQLVRRVRLRRQLLNVAEVGLDFVVNTELGSSPLYRSGFTLLDEVVIDLGVGIRQLPETTLTSVHGCSGVIADRLPHLPTVEGITEMVGATREELRNTRYEALQRLEAGLRFPDCFVVRLLAVLQTDSEVDFDFLLVAIYPQITGVLSKSCEFYLAFFSVSC